MLNPVGDMIGVSSNAAQVVAKWGNGSVHEKLLDIVSDIDSFDLYTHKGEHLVTQTMRGFLKGTGYMGNRRDILTVLCDYAFSLGLDIRLGHRISEYFETDNEAGIIVDGEKISADCVLACDGVHSKARGFVIGSTGTPKATGYATYRAWFDGKEVMADPASRWLVEDPKDKSVAFIGPDVHCIFGTGRHCQEVTWVFTHLVRHQLFSLLIISRIRTISRNHGRFQGKWKMPSNWWKVGIPESDRLLRKHRKISSSITSSSGEILYQGGVQTRRGSF
jgi:2-polyprenyl-6-methoxyphenol hydroxylase-like FAD-dependent oxidoreductase